MVELRGMRAADVDACVDIWHDAWFAMREEYGLPLPPRTDAAARSLARRLAHLLGTDPEGSIVAVADEGAGESAGDGDGGDAEGGGERVIGFAQALVRDDLWVLSLFGVTPRVQGQGVGRALLDASIECAGGRRGLILSSRDPSAMRRYGLAGFDLHPAVTGYGTLRPGAFTPAPPGAVREGTVADLDVVDRVDLAVRGARHGRADLQLLLDEGAQLLVHAAGTGYAFVTTKPVLLAATDDAAAGDLLRAALALVPPGAVTEVGWCTAAQQWAIRIALEAGLELHPVGPLGLRGFGAAPAAYLPIGAFG